MEARIPWTVTLSSNSGASSFNVNRSLDVLDDAIEYWERYFDFSAGTIDISVNFIPLGGTILAQAGTSFTQISGGLYQADTILETQTGTDQNGPDSDIEIDINTNVINANEFYYGGIDEPDVTVGLIDLFSTLVHEIGHGLGFISLTDQPETAVFDSFLSVSSGTYTFTGPLANGVILGEDPSHYGTTRYLMGSTASPGDRLLLTEIETKIFRDIGLPALLPTENDDILYGFDNDRTINLLDGNDRYTT